jgi:protein FrlC
MSRITMNDVSVMSVQFVQHTFSHYLDTLQECGLRLIDLWGGVPHFCALDHPDGSSAAASELRKEIEDRGMRVVIYTPETLNYPFSYSAPSQALRDRTVAYMKTAMADALSFGTDRVFLNTGCHPRDLPREEGWERTADSFRKLCRKAEEMGVKLVLEQLQPYESNLCICLGDIRRMLEEVDSPALRVCVDLVAMEVAGEDLQQYFHAFGDRIEWIHYSDSNHMIPGHGSFGREKLEGYIRTLEKNGFKNGIDLEINDSIYWEDPYSSVKQTAEYLRTFLPEK